MMGQQPFRPPSYLPAPYIVDTPEDLAPIRQALRGVKRFALDTESNSLYAYTPHVCLIQISTDYEDFLIDPLALDVSDNLLWLGDMLADPQIEKVLHAAEYDVMMLRRDYGFVFSNLFDTMIAARVLGWKHTGLGNILEASYGVKVNKRNQRADWGKRPLSAELLLYAQKDSHFLLPLRDEIYAQLEAGGHLEEAREMFDDVCRATWNGPQFDPEGFWRIKAVRSLNGQQTAVVRELYLLREELAQQRDIPPFKIFTDQVLVSLSIEQPMTHHEVVAMRGLSEHSARRTGAKIIRAIKRGLLADPPIPPRRNGRGHTNDAVQNRYEALHQWRKEKASDRRVPSDVILSREVLWELAHAAPQSHQDLQEIAHLGQWRRQTYGDEILRVVANTDTPAL
nr:HRDC domain-containing protein [Anaerolineae bacterium]